MNLLFKRKKVYLIIFILCIELIMMCTNLPKDEVIKFNSKVFVYLEYSIPRDEFPSDFDTILYRPFTLSEIDSIFYNSEWLVPNEIELLEKSIYVIKDSKSWQEKEEKREGAYIYTNTSYQYAEGITFIVNGSIKLKSSIKQGEYSIDLSLPYLKTLSEKSKTYPRHSYIIPICNLTKMFKLDKYDTIPKQILFNYKDNSLKLPIVKIAYF